MNAYIIYREAIGYRIELRNQFVAHVATLAEANTITGGKHRVWR